MPRRLRRDPGGIFYHVLNRRAGRATLFSKDEDYPAFEKVLAQAVQKFEMPLLCYCLMPNHWHLVLHPRRPGQLSRFMQWLTVTHMRRWHAHRRSIGTGPLYQGRFKSFPIQDDRHFLIVCRYVERNALRAGLCERAQDWRWSSLGRRIAPTEGDDRPRLSNDWPVKRPANWSSLVNEPQTEAQLQTLRRSIHRGSPFGDEKWVLQTAGRLRLQSSLRPIGRPKKQRESAASEK